MELNIDCQLIILELTDLSTLISLSETNKHLQHLVEYTLRHKFAKKCVAIVNPFAKDDFDDQVEIHNCVAINDFELASKVLTSFGHLIVSLELDFPTTDNQIEEINALVNLYCSKTLTELVVRADNGDIFRSMTKPFQKVENILLKKHIKSLCNKMMNFNDLFPALKRLNFVFIKVSDTRCIEQIFPYLEHLRIDINQFETFEYFTEPVLERFMQKNPHIRSISLQLVTPSVLRKVANTLNELEFLEIEHYYESSDVDYKIHFKNVTKFVFRESRYSAPSNMIFDELMELQIDAKPEKCTRWFQFIESNQNLQKIDVVGRDLSVTDIIRLTHSNLNASEISFYSDKDVTSEDIAYLIEGSRLQKVTLKKRISDKYRYLGNVMTTKSSNKKKNFDGKYDQKSVEAIKSTLKQFFGEKWKVKENISEIFLQKRKEKH